MNDPVVLDEARRRESLIDTFASWALEGMQPSAYDISAGIEYIKGKVTIEELIARAYSRYGIEKNG